MIEYSSEQHAANKWRQDSVSGAVNRSPWAHVRRVNENKLCSLEVPGFPCWLTLQPASTVCSRQSTSCQCPPSRKKRVRYGERLGSSERRRSYTTIVRLVLFL